MRVGVNPQKQHKKIDLETHHRVILVVYIPNEEGFYNKSFDVFKLSLDSLIATVNNNCAITVVNNGSYEKVTVLLNRYFEDNKIDTLINHRNNIGKIDALIGAARGSRETVITYTDSDILFVKGWQENVEKVFSAFGNVGSVSPIPVRYNLFYGTSSALLQILLKKVKIKFEAIPENFISYNRYLMSINWEEDVSDKKKWPIINKNGCNAIIGSGHQVLTVSRDILFKEVPTNPSLILVGGDSEYKYVDEPIDKSGKLRLSTYNNYAYHMGNLVEQWMLDVYQENLNKKVNVDFKFQFNKKQSNSIISKCNQKIYLLRKKIVKKIFKLFYKDFLKS